MKKRGFTLIELLGVFVILSILFLIITPTVNSIIANSKEKAFDRNVATILSGASDWATENSKYLPKESQKINITLSQLKQLGYVGLNIKNPKTGELFNNNMIITIENISGQTITNTEENVKYNGNYKFSIDLDTGDSSITYDEDAPTITLAGDMVQMVELNSQYEEPGYSALTSNKKDITSNVTSVIRTSSGDVNMIDTTTLGVYYKDYTVVDNSISTTVTRTIIVSDTIAPSITFDDTFISEISTNEQTINLLTGVSCNDNSGVCNITTSGNITPGVSGKYVIKYIVSDESGNTYSEKKVITIEKIEYTELEFIEFTGTQYINTLYKPNPNTKLQMDIQFVENENTYKENVNNAFVGISLYETNRFVANFGAISTQSKDIWYWTQGGFDGVNMWTANYDSVTDRSEFILTGTSATFQGITISTETKTSTNNGYLFLFANTYSDMIKPFNRYNCKLYSVNIYDENVLVRKYIPYRRDNDGEIGLYDSINNKFYTNQGTGEFVFGEK